MAAVTQTACAVVLQVTIDSRGMMRVAHMMVVGADGSAVGPSAQHGEFGSQSIHGGRRLTVDIQFVIACEEEDPDDYQEDAE